jgi:hypothetical protein
MSHPCRSDSLQFEQSQIVSANRVDGPSFENARRPDLVPESCLILRRVGKNAPTRRRASKVNGRSRIGSYTATNRRASSKVGNRGRDVAAGRDRWRSLRELRQPPGAWSL